MSIDLHPLGLVDYEPTYAAMQAFTSQRGLQPNKDVHDQLWICEHPPVFTQGLAGQAGHVLNAGDIPVVQTNRGGQVTYHGPGQVVAYPLLDLQRAGYFVKEYVYRLEEAVIRTLMHYGVTGHRVRGAPGIYVRLDDPFSHSKLPALTDSTTVRAELVEAPRLTHPKPLEPFDQLRANGCELGKIAALGIKVSRHCTYHGVALNVAMDLEPFTRINACGYAGLKTVDLRTIGVNVTWQDAADVFSQKLVSQLSP
jgi:lipoyl(octanoyl) transferase